MTFSTFILRPPATTTTTPAILKTSFTLISRLHNPDLLHTPSFQGFQPSALLSWRLHPQDLLWLPAFFHSQEARSAFWQLLSCSLPSRNQQPPTPRCSSASIQSSTSVTAPTASPTRALSACRSTSKGMFVMKALCLLVGLACDSEQLPPLFCLLLSLLIGSRKSPAPRFPAEARLAQAHCARRAPPPF